MCCDIEGEHLFHDISIPPKTRFEDILESILLKEMNFASWL